MRNLIAALFILALSGCTCYQQQNNKSYDMTEIPWGVFDIYTPDGPAPKNGWPVLFAIHGGAWEGGDKNWASAVADEFCCDGYAVVSPNYHLTIATVNTGTWPTQYTDLVKCLTFLKNTAPTWRLDMNRVASIGVSAGGHLATMVALRDSPVRPRIAIDCDGEMDMTQPGDKVMTDFYDVPAQEHLGIMTRVLGHPQPWSPDELQDISPVFFARKDVSVFVVHATQDPNVFFNNAVWITNALNAVGADLVFVPINSSDHSHAWQDPKSLSAMHTFLRKRL